MKSVYQHIIAFFLAVVIGLIVYSCVLKNYEVPGQLPVPSQTVPTPTPTPPTAPFAIEFPASVQVDTWHRIYVSLREDDDVWIFADGEYSLGAMNWNSITSQKYLDINLNTKGKRTLEFRVNGKFVYSLPVLVTNPQN